MSFAWIRSHDLPLNLPSDEKITQYILGCDPGFYLRHHWYEWRDVMLRGRDTYLGVFQRHQHIPGLYNQSPRSLSRFANWTPLNMDMVGSQEPRNWRVHSEYRNCLLGLEPYVEKKDQEPVSFLGLEIASNRVSPWDSTFNIHSSVRNFHPGYTEWARYILRTQEKVLHAIGIYKAVLLSIFHYEMNNNLLRAVIENWSPLSNTLYVEDGEITSTLWDMRNMAGSPILGHPYDEHVPKEEIIFGESEQGIPRSSQILKMLSERYYKLVLQRQDYISINSWILEFFSASSLKTEFPTPRDPFGIGSDNIQIQNLEPVKDPSGIVLEMDRKLCSAAFIACWLCYFVIPYGHGNRVRPEVLFMADLIESGVKVSLAPPALVNLYRSLREASVTNEPGRPDVVMPTHYLAGWMNIQFKGLYGTAASLSLRRQLPSLIDIADVPAVQLTFKTSRQLFCQINRVSHLAKVIYASFSSMPVEVRKCADEVTLRPPPEELESCEFLISIRSGFLPFRSGHVGYFEIYSPHRCARQFGLDQLIPQTVSLPCEFTMDLSGLAICWESLLRCGTGTHFCMPDRNRSPRCSYDYLKWHALHLQTYRSYDLDIIPTIIHKGKKQRFSGHSPSRSIRKKEDFSFEFDLSLPPSKRQRIEDVIKPLEPSNITADDLQGNSSPILQDFIRSTDFPSHPYESLQPRADLPPSPPPLGIDAEEKTNIPLPSVLGGSSQFLCQSIIPAANDVLVDDLPQLNPLASDSPYDFVSRQIVDSTLAPAFQGHHEPPIDEVSGIESELEEIQITNNPPLNSNSFHSTPLDAIPISCASIAAFDSVVRPLPSVNSSERHYSAPSLFTSHSDKVVNRVVEAMIDAYLEGILGDNQFPSLQDFRRSTQRISPALLSLGASENAWREFCRGMENDIAQIEEYQELLSKGPLVKDYEERLSSSRSTLANIEVQLSAESIAVKGNEDIVYEFHSQRLVVVAFQCSLRGDLRRIDNEIFSLRSRRRDVIRQLEEVQDQTISICERQQHAEDTLQQCQADLETWKMAREDAYIAQSTALSALVDFKNKREMLQRVIAKRREDVFNRAADFCSAFKAT